MSNQAGRILRMEKDFGPTCDVELPAMETLSVKGTTEFQEAIDRLMILEKQTRNAGDLASNMRIQVHILQVCFNAANLRALNDNVVSLTKKHGAFKQATQHMIQEAVAYVDRMPTKEARLELVNTLRAVTEGKIYVEVDRARLTRILAKIREDEGNIVEAAEILQEMQVETFGSMEKREKTDFILEQMRLCFAKKDYARTRIVSRKISTKFLELLDSQDLKLRFYELMIKLALVNEGYLEACKCYRHVYATQVVLDDEAKWQEILTYAVVFAVLSPYDTDQAETVKQLANEDRMAKAPALASFLKYFITPELISWPNIEQLHKAKLAATYVFCPDTEEGMSRWDDFHKRVVEHNLRIIAKYYTRISYTRLTELLSLSAPQVETVLSGLVSSKTIYAKIDRPAQIVVFSKPLACEDILNSWSTNIHDLLRLLEKTTHLITKEEMVNSILSASQ